MKTAICTLLLFAGIAIANEISAQTISTLAGSSVSGYCGDGGAATSACLNRPKGVALDASGNVYIADADNNRIRMVTTAGTISTIAGNAAAGYGGDGGPAISATLNRPDDIKLDAAGNIYISDADNHCIRKINTSGTISTIAGIPGSPGFSGDGGAATSAELNFPAAIALDAAGNLYIADEYNSRIRKVNTSGTISTFAGTGSGPYSGPGSSATTTDIGFVFGVAADGAGTVYMSLLYDNIVAKVNTSGIVSTFAGTGTAGFGGDGGPATAAMMDGQWGIAADAAGNVYIADFNNQRIRKVNVSGTISTVAGNGSSGFSGDGGLATLAKLQDPAGVTAGPGGSVYIADYNNHRIRKVAGTATSTPTFTGGHHQTFSVCQDAAATSINTLLSVADADLGDTETWSTLASPLHGTLLAAYSTTSTGLTLTPTGLTYTPTAGYAGTDSFKVRITDGSASDTTTVVVTVTPLPTAGTITGTDSTCPGHTVTLFDAVTGGTWNSSNTAIATIAATGIVTGVAPGTVTITYTVTNSCSSATATRTFKVRPYSACPTSVNNTTAISTCSIFPNPSDGTFTVSFPTATEQDIHITITNVVGQKITEIATISNHETTVALNAPAGIYFLNATSGANRWNTRIIVAQ